jgi:hypothetical protein
MLPSCRRSKRLQIKLTGKHDLIGSESEDDVFVNIENGKSGLLTVLKYEDVWINEVLILSTLDAVPHGFSIITRSYGLYFNFDLQFCAYSRSRWTNFAFR